MVAYGEGKGDRVCSRVRGFEASRLRGFVSAFAPWHLLTPGRYIYIAISGMLQHLRLRSIQGGPSFMPAAPLAILHMPYIHYTTEAHGRARTPQVARDDALRLESEATEVSD